MKSHWILLSGLFYFCSLSGAVHAEELLTETIGRLREDISYLASDELQGRDVGSPGIDDAGQYIAQRFADLKLNTGAFDGSPFQEFTMPGPAQMGASERNLLTFSGLQPPLELVLGEDFNSLSLGNSGKFDGQIVFAGYGITAPDLGYDDYQGIDVEGKVVIVIRKEPQQSMENSIFEGRRSSQHAFFSVKEANAAVHKAAALIMVNDAVSAASKDEILGVNDAGKAQTNQQVPTLYCSRAIVDRLLLQGMGKGLSELELAIDADLKPRSQVLAGITSAGETRIEQTQLPARNVIGLLPGVGELADEYVVVGAHYDHVGMGGRGGGSLAPGTIAVHNGADDNASGTTAMMEVARRMAEDQSVNRRSILFMAFSAEERGLLGSKHYVRNPRWPLEKTVAMVNMDMVGRLNDNRLTVYGTGTAENFDALVERLNQAAQFNLEKWPYGYGPSDHSSFYQENIPVFHFFTGLHNDYHRPGDDPEKLNYEGMARIAAMVTQVVTELATSPQKPAHLQVSGSANPSRQNAPPSRAVLGIQLDLEYEGDGAGIDRVTPESPASAAGLQAGDVIIQIGETPIASIRDLRTFLATKKPGDQIEVLIRRGEEQIRATITLGRG